MSCEPPVDRTTIGYDRARRAFVEQRAAALMELRQVDLRQHVARCPLADEIHIQDGSTVWHRDDHCDELYNSGREIRSFQVSAICAQQKLIVPGDDASAFFDEHGVRVVNAHPNWMQFN